MPTSDHDFLQAALRGYIHRLAEVSNRISELMDGMPPKRRTMSLAGRRKIAAAQRKRWAELKSKKDEQEKPKRKMSAAARKRMALAMKRRWARAKKSGKKSLA